MQKNKKERLDILLVKRGLVESRENAARLILAGLVKTEGQLLTKPGMKINETVKVDIEKSEIFVGKGAKKIESAYKKFKLNFNNKIIADIGASTGGFTDFALSKGAQKVYAVDVGYGQLAYKLRQNVKVINMERNDIRSIEKFPDKIDIFLIDVSFVSLKKILPKIKEIIKNQNHKAEVVILVKPQFEVGKKIADKFKGVIKNKKIQQKIVREISKFVAEEKFAVISSTKAAVQGEKGNQEYFLYLRFPKIVKVFGTFDLVHKGHSYFLSKASEYGELIVVIPSDDKVLELKKKKPIHSLVHRVKNIEKLGFKAEIEKEDPWQNIIENKADVIVLGYDQSWEAEIRRKIKETGYLVKIRKIKKAYKPEIFKSSHFRKKFD